MEIPRPGSSPALPRAVASVSLLAAAGLAGCSGTAAPEARDRPEVSILAPPDGASVEVGVDRPLTLRGEAVDPQDGELTGTSLRWRSDREGELGSGRTVELERLARGRHRITLVATDDAGHSASDTRRLVVERIVGPRVVISPDTLVLTALEDTATFSATVLRSRGDTADPAEVAIAWSSGDTAVAVSRGDGRFRARANGRAAITARALDAPGRAVLEVRDGWRSVTAGRQHTCGLATDSLAYCWGGNGAGQLGDGSRETRLGPVPVAGGRRFASLDAGARHTCAVGAGGDLFCWGANGRGQLGVGDTDPRGEPARVRSARSFRAVSAGGQHTCAAAEDGTLFCWGAGGYGQIGDGGRSDRLTPTPVDAGDFATVAAGAFHTCATSPNGLLACWGRNDRGQLGLGDTSLRTTPTAQREIRAFRAAAAGGFHACALSGGSAAFCWGANGSGQVGNGTRQRQLKRAAVEGGGDFAAISGGARHTCAVTPEGALYCWGDNGDGQLGDGSGEDRLTAGRVAVDGKVRDVSAGAGHTCAVTATWTALCWGDGGSGQLGTGETSSARRPVRVVSP